MGERMKITILQAGETPKQMRPRFERYPKQFQQLLSANDDGLTFETKYIIEGEAFPAPTSLEVVIITGSAYGVYDAPDWVNDLREFIRQSYEAKIPMLGICFGHQIMADALGGRVEKSQKGWGIGRHIYSFRQKPPFMNGAKEKVAIAASHQDQVIKAPKEAEIFLSSEFTPIAGLLYKNNAAISLQPHPEFDVEYAKALVDRLNDGSLSKEQAEQAHKSLEEPLDSMEIGKGLAQFFRQAAKISAF